MSRFELPSEGASLTARRLLARRSHMSCLQSEVRQLEFDDQVNHNQDRRAHLDEARLRDDWLTFKAWLTEDVGGKMSEHSVKTPRHSIYLFILHFHKSILLIKRCKCKLSDWCDFLISPKSINQSVRQLFSKLFFAITNSNSQTFTHCKNSSFNIFS